MQIDTFQALYNEDIERSILSNLMLDPHLSGSDELKVEDFYLMRHQRTFQGIHNLSSKNQPVDLVSLGAELEKNGHLTEIGGRAWLAELYAETCSTEAAKHHIELLKELAQQRRLQKLGKWILHATTEQKPSQEITQTIEKTLTESQAITAWVAAQDAVQSSLEEIESAFRDERRQGLSTGLVDLDARIGGLNPGNLIIVAGRPGMGKTSLGLGCLEAAARQGGTVGVFSLEMSNNEILKRLLTMNSTNLSVGRLERGALTREGWASLTIAAEDIGSRQIFFCDTATLTADGVQGKARALHRQHGLDLLVIDYLQLMTPDRKAENRTTAMSEISRALKILAKDLHIPIIALSQLNRSCESRPDRRPLLSDLRESGAIEQDADVVMFLYRDEVYDAESPDRGIAEVLIRKNRHGPIGEVRVSWCGEQTVFRNLSCQHEQGGG